MTVQWLNRPQLHPVEHEPEAIQGRRVRLTTQQNGAGQYIVQSTQLISARVKQPREWVVTLLQASKGGHAVGPWEYTEGSATWPADATVPVIPIGAQQRMQVALRWGAGGASFTSKFDYPDAGGAFGITADTLDLNVAFKQPATSTPYTSLDDVPMVGAWMVEGRAADPTPLRWREISKGLGGAGATAAFWTVKPWSRKLHVSTGSGTAPAGALLQFLDGASALLWEKSLAGASAAIVDVEIDVPAEAVGIKITNGATPAIYYLEWKIGLV
jgi:hypothetical protein